MPQPQKYKNNAARQAAYRVRCREAQKQQAEPHALPPLPPFPTLPGPARGRASRIRAHSLVEVSGSLRQTDTQERSQAWQESERAQEMLLHLQTREEGREQRQILL